MKKKIIIVSIFLIILIIGTIGGLNYKKYTTNDRYEEMKKELDEVTTKYIKRFYPYCEPGTRNLTIKEDTLLYHWGVDKNILLDVDEKSYCNVRIEVSCVAENEYSNNVYLKCMDYEDEKYGNWEGATNKED